MTFTSGAVRPDALKAEQDAFFKDPNKVNKLYAEIAKNPRMRGALMERMRQFESYGGVMDQNYERAVKYIQDYNNQALEFVRDPNQYNAALKIANPGFYEAGKDGVTYTGQFEDLLADNTKWQRATMLNDYFSRQIQTAANTTGFATIAYDPESKAGYWQIRDQKNWNQFIDAQTNVLVSRVPEALVDYWENATGQEISIDDKVALKEAAKDYLGKMLPTKGELRMTAKPVSGGGDRGGRDMAKYSSTSPVLTKSVIPSASSVYGWTSPQSDQVYAVTLTSKVGNQQVEAGTMPFEKTLPNGNVAQVDLIPTRIEVSKANGTGYVIGYNPNNILTTQETEAGSEIDEIVIDNNQATVKIKGSDGTITTRKITERTLDYVPLNTVNVGLVSQNWPGIQDKINKAFGAGGTVGINSLAL